ncbi:MAG: hypothetical protein ABIV43_00965 [Candidatus Saccharimonadales bacterium]
MAELLGLPRHADSQNAYPAAVSQCILFSMNPQSSPGPELQLPAPVSPSSPLPAIGQPPIGPQPPAQPGLPPPQMPPMPGANQPQPAKSVPTGAVQTTTNIVVPATADDSDLIEKEWVSKAKQLVDKTRMDPHQQSEMLTHLKNDYMQKRYNKSLKLSE